jgi:hypothetical protein
MQELYVEGVASRNGPELCVWRRKSPCEALTGVSMGADIEPRKYMLEADAVDAAEGDVR